MKNKNFLKLLVALIIPQLFGIVGSLFTDLSVNGWYNSLLKPAFNPPNWLFGLVWPILFLLMGIAVFLVWKKGLNKKEEKFAIGLFIFQLFLNLFWSFIFFTLKNPGIALTELISLWFAVLASMIAFWQISKPAGWLMLPYIVWITFAGVLNYSIWNLNINSNIQAPIASYEIQLDSGDKIKIKRETFNNDMVTDESTIIEINVAD